MEGGFLRPHRTPYSPAPSTSIASTSFHPLPHPRDHPLKSGSAKESAFIRYIDQGILRVQRRFAKRDDVDDPADEDTTTATDESSGVKSEDEVKGYKNFREAGRDIEALVDLVWVSGTPSLQVPFLIQLGMLLQQFIPELPPSPRAMFRLIRKMDTAFAGLIQGRDVDTGEVLPGQVPGRVNVSVTEKVRVKSLVERTRVAVARVMSEGEFEAGDDEEEEEETEEDEMDVEEMVEDVKGRYDMDVARVYDRTLVELGDTLGGDPIGLQTE